MSKDEIKSKLYEAVQRDKHCADIKSVAIFGSYAAGTETKDSDIDVLVEFKPSARIGFFALSDIKQNFEASLNKQVDLLTSDAISKYFRDEVLRRAEYVYAK